MVVIGKIKISREIKKRLLPPVYEPVVKGPTFTPVVEAPLFSHAPPTLMQGGGGAPGAPGGKAVHVVINEAVTVGAGSVARTVTLGTVGISYTSTSFTLDSFTVVVGVITKALSETVTITEPLSVTRSKTRVLFEEVPDNSESSDTVTIETTKVRAISETVDITESVEQRVATKISKQIADTVDIIEAATTYKAANRALATETVEESDDVGFVSPTLLRTLSETEEISDSVAIEITYASGHIFRELIENTTVSDSASVRVTKVRALATETIATAEIVSRETTTLFVSYMTTSFTSLSYTATETVRRVEKLLLESEEISDTVRIETTKARGLVETVDIVG
jgi:hypothetical protein